MIGAWSWLTRGPPRKLLLISAVGTTFGCVYLLRDSFKGAGFEKAINCDGKVAIVTGANAGIGKETARTLARRGAVVFMLCRDKDRCDKARREIILETRNKYVYSRLCDLSSLDSVRNFVKQFKSEEKRLDILVNNAGVWHVPYGKTKDGFEVHLGVNHMGHFLLTNLLLDVLKSSSPSRIINVTSVAHLRGKINKEDLNSDTAYSKAAAYNQSKLANVLFTRELAERLEGTGVTVNAVHPGIVATNLFNPLSTSLSARLWTSLLKPFMWMFFKTPEGGAQTTIYAALDPDLEKISGQYFANCKHEPWGPHADKETAKWLWAVSEKWTQLREDPRHRGETINLRDQDLN